MSLITYTNWKHRRKGNYVKCSSAYLVCTVQSHHIYAPGIPTSLHHWTLALGIPSLLPPISAPTCASALTILPQWLVLICPQSIKYFPYSTSHHIWFSFIYLPISPHWILSSLKKICHILPYLFQCYSVDHSKCILSLNEQKKSQCLW